MIRISACVIVKNEERNLPRWLACMKKLADEIIVVDTGSTDCTVQIAETSGARVCHFAWINDFAAAKNYAIEQATGDWILFPDADEYFPDKDCPKVAACIQRFHPRRNIIGFISRWVNIDENHGGIVRNEGRQVRVFRRCPQLRYVGAIHEMLQYAATGGELLQVEDFRIMHTGYSEGIIREKLERDLAILLEQRRRRGPQPSDAFYLADCCYGLGDYKETAKYAREAISSGMRMLGRDNRPYALLLQSMSALGNSLHEIESVLKEAQERYPYVGDFSVLAGIAAWNRRDLLKAEQWLQDGINLYREAEKRPADPWVTEERTKLLPLAVTYLDKIKGANRTQPISKHMTISACVITKNEEKNMRRWFSYAKALADEIIVVDTGSTDRTVEIAREQGAKVSFFSWKKDFAAAKNYAIEQATGDWIAFLDADEYFLPEDCPKVRKLLENTAVTRDIWIFRRIDINVDEQNKFIGESAQRRIFRRKEGLRYKGAVHEELCDASGNEPGTNFASEPLIYHTGYSSKVAEEKLHRNLEILLAQRHERGPLPRDSFYLADCYYGLGDYEQAAHFAEEAVNSGLIAEGMGSRIYAVWIQSLINAKHPKTEIETAAHRSCARYPELPDFWLMYGSFLFEEKAYLDAEKALHKGIELYEKIKTRSQDGVSGNQTANFMPVAFWHLGKIMNMSHRPGEALEYFIQGLRLEPYSMTLLQEITRLLTNIPTADSIELFNDIYDVDRDAAWLSKALSRTAIGSAALYYDRKAGGVLTQSERFRLAGKVSAFAATVSEEAEGLGLLGKTLEPMQGPLPLLLPSIMQKKNAVTEHELLACKAIETARMELSKGLGQE